MKEIAHILVSYYMWWKTVKDAEKKSAEDDLENCLACWKIINKEQQDKRRKEHNK